MAIKNLIKTAEALGIKPWSLRLLARRGLVPFIFISRKYYFDTDVLQEFLAKEMERNVRTGESP